MCRKFGLLLAGVCLSALSVAAGAKPLPIDDCPGVAGQPQTRRDIVTEYIRIPSIAHPKGSPAALDQMNFLRVRLADPKQAGHADAILIQAIPNGASSFSESATQLVEMGAKLGKVFEVWGVQRREKNLQDMVGLREAYAKHDPSLALKYYYGDHYLDAHGKFDGKVGGPGATFKPLTAADMPFLSDWGVEVAEQDLESILDLVPKARRNTNVFLYSAAPGGYYLSEFAGFKLSDGNRGYQELAGLIAIEGQLTKSTIGSGEPDQKAVDKYVEDVKAVRDNKIPRFFDDDQHTKLLASGPRIAIGAEISLMAAMFQPNKESIFPLDPQAMGGTAADDFNAHLRLTNLARAGFALSDDPIPGTFLSSYFLSYFGGGLGHLDFKPKPGAPVCAVPGPVGMKPPCVPSLAQIDSGKVYGWVDGGPGTKGSPLAGWAVTPDGAYTNASVNGRPGMTHLMTAIQAFGEPATLTNATPITIDLPGGQRTIDSSFNVSWSWYAANRFHTVDVPFVNKYQKVFVDKPDLGIHLDFDKTKIAIPVIEYTVHYDTVNPWPETVKDFTVIDLHGLTATPVAAKTVPMNPAVNVGLYKNVDIHSADNSRGADALAGKITPGMPGANPISDTLPQWIIAHMGKSGVDVPDFQSHPSCRANPV